MLPPALYLGHATCTNAINVISPYDNGRRRLAFRLLRLTPATTNSGLDMLFIIFSVKHMNTMTMTSVRERAYVRRDVINVSVSTRTLAAGGRPIRWLNKWACMEVCMAEASCAYRHQRHAAGGRCMWWCVSSRLLPAAHHYLYRHASTLPALPRCTGGVHRAAHCLPTPAQTPLHLRRYTHTRPRHCLPAWHVRVDCRPTRDSRWATLVCKYDSTNGDSRLVTDEQFD